MSSDQIYLYAFAPAGVMAPIAGIGDAPVRSLGSEAIFAIVSDAPAGRIRPQRKHLAAHQNVITELARLGDVLPASFGMISDEESLEALLQDSRDALLDELGRVGGCVEYSLRLRWESGAAFHKLVDADAELRDLRARLVALGDRAPHDLRVSVGRRVEAVLNALRHDAATQLHEVAEAACREVSVDDPRDEHELANLACLVPRDGTAAFEAAVEAASAAFDDSMTLDISGPFAPHHFVRLELSPAGARRSAA